MRILLIKSHKNSIKIWVYKPTFSAPGGPQPYISSHCQGWANLGFWEDRGSHVTWFLEQMVREVYFKNAELSRICSRLWHLKYRATIYSGKTLTGFRCLLQYQVFINWTGIQLVFELGNEFTENNWLLFCEVLLCTRSDTWLCIRERNNIVNSWQQMVTLLKVWFYWLIIVLMHEYECVLWINGIELKMIFDFNCSDKNSMSCGIYWLASLGLLSMPTGLLDPFSPLF